MGYKCQEDLSSQSKLLMIRGFWEDYDGNKWDGKLYSEKQANYLCRTLVACQNCVNCSFCQFCVGCVNCINCNMCGLCNGCRFCSNCIKVKGNPQRLLVKIFLEESGKAGQELQEPVEVTFYNTEKGVQVSTDLKKVFRDQQDEQSLAMENYMGFSLSGYLDLVDSVFKACPVNRNKFVWAMLDALDAFGLLDTGKELLAERKEKKRK